MTKLIPVLVASAILVAGCSRAPRRRPTRRRRRRRSRSRRCRRSSRPRCWNISACSSSDEFEGRKPGTPGEERTVQYLTGRVPEARAQAGQHRRQLHPEGAARRHHRHRRPSRSSLRARPRATFKWRDDVVAWTKHVADGAQHRQLRARLRRLRRRRARVRLGRLQGRRRQGQDDGRARQRSARSGSRRSVEARRRTFNGKAMTYYGRWTYKYEEARAQGRGRRAHRARDGTGRVSVRRRAGEPRARSSTW